MRTVEQLLETLDAGNVQRFHQTPGWQGQDVSSHSWRAAIILHWLTPKLPGWVVMKMLIHDVGEIRTGDVPAPIKWDNPDLGKRLNEIEEHATVEMGYEFPEHEYWDARIKAADALELMFTCLEERGKGNTYADQVMQKIALYLIERKWLVPAEALLAAACLCRYQEIGGPRTQAILEGLEDEFLERTDAC